MRMSSYAEMTLELKEHLETPAPVLGSGEIRSKEVHCCILSNLAKSIFMYTVFR